jgi:hypothetical protein
VDLSEAIDTGDASFLDNTEFTDTDAVPLNTPLPSAHYLVDEVSSGSFSLSSDLSALYFLKC